VSLCKKYKGVGNLFNETRSTIENRENVARYFSSTIFLYHIIRRVILIGAIKKIKCHILAAAMNMTRVQEVLEIGKIIQRKHFVFSLLQPQSCVIFFT
jgi:hypothetical protein